MYTHIHLCGLISLGPEPQKPNPEPFTRPPMILLASQGLDTGAPILRDEAGGSPAAHSRHSRQRTSQGGTTQPSRPTHPPLRPGSAQQGLHKPNRSGSNRSSDSPDQERGDRGGGVGDGNGLDGSGGAVGEFGPAGSGGGTPACAQPASAAALSVQEVLTARPSTTGGSAGLGSSGFQGGSEGVVEDAGSR